VLSWGRRRRGSILAIVAMGTICGFAASSSTAWGRVFGRFWAPAVIADAALESLLVAAVVMNPRWARGRREALVGARVSAFWRSRLRDERGIALVLSLLALLCLSVAATAVIDYTSSNSRSTAVSMGQQNALALAEAGVASALSVINAPSNNASLQSTLPSSLATAFSQTYPTGTAKSWGVLTNTTWTLYGQGIVRNPTGAAQLTHTVSEKVDVSTSLVSTLNTQQWDFIMSTATGSACDVTIAGGGNTGSPDTILSRLYVFGNLCIGTSQGGVGHVNTGPLLVKGKVTINEGSSGVGTSGAPINELHVGQGCKYLSNTLHNPCQQGAGSSGKDNVYSSVIDNSVAAVTAPVADFAGWYDNASPGPKSACGTTSGTPPVFDNNTVRDTSITTAFELTPAASYTCRVTSGSTTTGEISWNASTKTLTVAGTIYIDGSAKVTDGVMNQYNGQATLYLSGTFYMSSGSGLCGAILSGNCDFNGWNPNTELLGIVANGNGAPSPVPANHSIYLYNAQFQGALYGTNMIRLEGTTQTAGPMVASSVELGYNVSTSSSTNKAFPVVTSVPAGLPGVPNAHAQPGAPYAFTG
jgi:Tfp pilus assembly protein PilX